MRIKRKKDPRTTTARSFFPFRCAAMPNWCFHCRAWHSSILACKRGYLSRRLRGPRGPHRRHSRSLPFSPPRSTLCMPHPPTCLISHTCNRARDGLCSRSMMSLSWRDYVCSEHSNPYLGPGMWILCLSIMYEGHSVAVVICALALVRAGCLF